MRNNTNQLKQWWGRQEMWQISTDFSIVNKPKSIFWKTFKTPEAKWHEDQVDDSAKPLIKQLQDVTVIIRSRVTGKYLGFEFH